jgi:lysozyme family protein
MSTRQITAITTALQCPRGRLQVTAAGLAVAVLAAGCGSSSSTTTNTSAAKSPARTSAASAPAAWTGMGLSWRRSKRHTAR